MYDLFQHKNAFTPDCAKLSQNLPLGRKEKPFFMVKNNVNLLIYYILFFIF